MKLAELIDSLQRLEKEVGNIETVLYAYGGDHGGFLYPSDAILGKTLIIKDENISSVFPQFPNYHIENCGVEKDTKNLAVLSFKYSIEVDEIRNDYEKFDLDFIAGEIIDTSLEKDSNEKEKLLSNLKWLEKASIFDFKKNTIKVAKTYFGEENISPNGNYNLTI